jgi:hypothetical protein
MQLTTGGKNMSAARTFCIFISLLALLTITIYTGCSPNRTGTATPNSIPEVFITNTPPDSAQFSRNPDLNWYATDIDGYITSFRFAVIVDSMLLINGVHVTPSEFADQATDEQFGWTYKPVDLDHPQSTATIRLYSNVDFPVDSFVTQYFFLQASDDQGAWSEIVWRMYSRNNHFPNTHFRARDFYINATDPNSPAPGISLTYDGADSADWGRAQPPLEYEWRLYGPFERDAIIKVNLVKENCIYDPTVDSFINCINVPVLDLSQIPPAVGNVPQPLLHSEGPNYANDTTDVWVTETKATLYNVYQSLNLTKTSRYKFVFWVRARDDGFVPDPTPPFAQFDVYEAKFERPVMVIDETGYTVQVGRWAPKDMDLCKAYFYDVLNETLDNLSATSGINYGNFDTLFIKDSVNVAGAIDYFYSASKLGQSHTGPAPADSAKPRLIDVLSHKVIIYFNDDVETGTNESQFGYLGRVYDGLDMGASGWVMTRDMGNANVNIEAGTVIPMSIDFQMRFGFSEVVCEGWFHDAFILKSFNEQYVGAYSNVSGFPNIDVDYGLGSRLDSLYPRYFIDPTHVMEGQPEVGIGTRTTFTVPLYLYLSKDGDQSFFHGKVNAVLQQLGTMRTATFMFTPLAMDPEPMNQTFGTIMSFLISKFDDAGKSSTIDVPAYNTAFSSLAERRARIDQLLKYMSEEATPEEQADYGLQPLPPFEVTPTDIIIH